MTHKMIKSANDDEVFVLGIAAVIPVTVITVGYPSLVVSMTFITLLFSSWLLCVCVIKCFSALSPSLSPSLIGS